MRRQVRITTRKEATPPPRTRQPCSQESSNRADRSMAPFRGLKTTKIGRASGLASDADCTGSKRVGARANGPNVCSVRLTRMPQESLRSSQLNFLASLEGHSKRECGRTIHPLLDFRSIFADLGPIVVIRRPRPSPWLAYPLKSSRPSRSAAPVGWLCCLPPFPALTQ
ncbi:hypothetical protein L209DRAFT_571876 [Thermothelomyces heterothallicus CBS 203.75]